MVRFNKFANAVAAAATATVDAASHRQHTIERISASYDAAFIGLLTVRFGNTIVWQGHIHNSGHDIPLDITASENTAVSAEISAAGAGVTGRVNMSGHTDY